MKKTKSLHHCRRLTASTISHAVRWHLHIQLSLPERTQAFLTCFGSIQQHFALKRHLSRASSHRKQLAAGGVHWHCPKAVHRSLNKGFACASLHPLIRTFTKPLRRIADAVELRNGNGGKEVPEI